MRHLLILFIVIGLFSCGKQRKNTIDSSVLVNNYSILENFEQKKGGASLLFNETEYEFPAAQKGSDLEHSFYFVNNGDAPLVLTNVKGSCGCTNVDYPEEPIKPGNKGLITAEVNNSNKPVDKKFRVSITIESNAQEPKMRLNLRGFTLGRN
jgi:hypothetical protein